MPTPEKLLERVDDVSAWGGWRFKVLALYRNTGTNDKGESCDCACCVFKQFVDGEQVETTKRVKPQKRPISGEDCFDIGRPPKRVCYGAGAPELKYDPAWEADPSKKPGSFEYSSPTGKVEKAPPGLDALIGSALEGTGQTRDTVCVYYMEDKPGAELRMFWHTRKDVCFTGTVYNKCPAEVPIISEKFRLYMAGSYEPQVVAPGAVPTIAWDAKPDGNRQYIPKCEPPK